MFTAIYNYLKSRTLPRSHSSLNRLYVERETKSRRILSNFGATFRNTKWADYSHKNVDEADFWNHRNSTYWTLVPIFVGVIALLWVFWYLDTIKPLLDFLYDHYEGVHGWMIEVYITVPGFFSHFLKWVGLKLIHHLSDTPSFPVETSSPSMKTQKKKYALQPKGRVDAAYRDEINWGLLRSISTNSLEKPLFLDLLPITYKLMLQEAELNSHRSYANPDLYSTPLRYDTPELTATRYAEPTNAFSSARYGLTSGEPFTYLGPFNSTNLNYQRLNQLVQQPAFFLTSARVSDRNSLVGLLRWTFKYGGLHHKTVLNSHKLTSAKRLIASGFYTPDLNQKNLWVWDHFFETTLSQMTNQGSDLKSKGEGFKTSPNTLSQYDFKLWQDMDKNNSKAPQVQSMFKNQWDALYGPLFNFRAKSFRSTNNTGNSAYQDFHLLSQYESSFQFFVKRIFNFNTLTDNTLISTTLPQHRSLKDYELKSLYVRSLTNPATTKTPLFSTALFNPKVYQSYSWQGVDSDSVLPQKDVNNTVSGENIFFGDNLKMVVNLTFLTSTNGNAFFYTSSRSSCRRCDFSDCNPLLAARTPRAPLAPTWRR